MTKVGRLGNSPHGLVITLPLPVRNSGARACVDLQGSNPIPGKFMQDGSKISPANRPRRWPRYIMAHRRPRDWLMTISGIVLLFVVAAAVAMGYLVTSHPGKPEPNPGIVEEEAAENGG